MPIYGGWWFNLGHGIVGGRLVDLREHGRAAGALGLQLLNGEVPVERLLASPNVWAFDDAQLRRYGIDSQRLPPGSQMINRPQSLLERHSTALLVTPQVSAISW